MLRTVCLASACAGVALAIAHAQAAESRVYPTKPIRLVLPFPPGGGVDVLARIMVPKLSETLGQQVIVDNRGGAAGNIAAEIVVKSPPDGYTLLMGISTLAINPAVYKKVPYDALRDFAPIALAVTLPT